jgi:hypothetical protein
MVALLDCQGAHEVQSVGIARIYIQDLAVYLFSLLHAPGLMLLQGKRQRFGDRGHRGHDNMEVGRAQSARAMAWQPAKNDLSCFLESCVSFAGGQQK